MQKSIEIHLPDYEIPQLSSRYCACLTVYLKILQELARRNEEERRQKALDEQERIRQNQLEEQRRLQQAQLRRELEEQRRLQQQLRQQQFETEPVSKMILKTIIF